MTTQILPTIEEQIDDIWLDVYENLMMELEFDPYGNTEPTPDPEPWNLEDISTPAYPTSVRDMISQLSGRTDVTEYTQSQATLLGLMIATEEAS